MFLLVCALNTYQSMPNPYVHTVSVLFILFGSLLECPMSTHEHLPNQCVHNVSDHLFIIVVSARVCPEYSPKSPKSLCTQRFVAFCFCFLCLRFAPNTRHTNESKAFVYSQRTAHSHCYDKLSDVVIPELDPYVPGFPWSW